MNSNHLLTKIQLSNFVENISGDENSNLVACWHEILIKANLILGMVDAQTH
jgi:hypothetical protein